MTTKKRLLGVMAVLSVGAVAFAGTVVAVAAAQDDDESGRRSFVDRVASILGIESETVQDAFDQASEEIATEKREEYVDALVEKDAVTQEEATELREWWSETPDAVPFRGSHEFGGGYYSFGDKSFGKFGFGSEDHDISDWLDALVEKEMMTQEEADELQAWLSAAPDVSPFMEKEDSDRTRHFSFGRRSFGQLPFGGFEPGVSPGDPSEWLDSLVENGLMTQEEADELRAWLDNLPDSFEEGMPGLPSQRSFEFDSDDGKFRFRGHWGRHGSDDDSSKQNSEESEEGSDTDIRYGDPI